MPSLQEALYHYLTLQPRVTALVGLRIFPQIAPQNTPVPYITVQRIAVGNDYHLLGPTDTHDTGIQVDCWALTARQGQGIATQVRHALEGLVGPWDDLEIDGVYITSEIDLADAAEDGSERIDYRTVLSIEVAHEYDRDT